jgi:hypothetical protein
LASSNYTITVQDFSNANNVKFVAKVDNPASLSEAWLIEDFWSILKGFVYKDGWKVLTLKSENTDALAKIIKYCLSRSKPCTAPCRVDS